MKLILASLDATHIGSGEVVYPFEFIQYEKNIYLVDYILVFNEMMALYPNKQNTIKEYIDFLSKKLLEGNLKKDEYKKLSFENLFIDNMGLSQSDYESFIKRLIEQKKFRIKLAKGNLPKTKVNLHIRDGNGKPYIPGSSIKGAILTKMLKMYLSENPSSDYSHKYFKNAINDTETFTNDLKYEQVFLNNNGLLSLSSIIQISDFYPLKSCLLKIKQPKLLTTKIQEQLNEYEVACDPYEFNGNINIDYSLLKASLLGKNKDDLKNPIIFEIFFGISFDQLLEYLNDEEKIQHLFNEHLKKVINWNSLNYRTIDSKWIKLINTDIYEDEYNREFSSLLNFQRDLRNDSKSGCRFIKIGWGSQLHGISVFPELIKWYEQLENTQEKIDIENKIIALVKNKIMRVNNRKKDMTKNELNLSNLPISRRIIQEYFNNDNENGIETSFVGWYEVQFK